MKESPSSRRDLTEHFTGRKDSAGIAFRGEPCIACWSAEMALSQDDLTDQHSVSGHRAMTAALSIMCTVFSSYEEYFRLELRVLRVKTRVQWAAALPTNCLRFAHCGV
jgi:hypothetical protein